MSIPDNADYRVVIVVILEVVGGGEDKRENQIKWDRGTTAHDRADNERDTNEHRVDSQVVRNTSGNTSNHLMLARFGQALPCVRATLVCPRFRLADCTFGFPGGPPGTLLGLLESA